MCAYSIISIRVMIDIILISKFTIKKPIYIQGVAEFDRQTEMW